MKIIAINGKKNCGKERFCEIAEKNQNISYIRPWTSNMDAPQDFIRISKEKMYVKMGEEPPLHSTYINGEIYCHFESQLNNDFNFLILDDYAIEECKKNANCDVVTIFVKNEKAEDSERSGHYLPISSYDYVFSVTDDIDEFLEEITFDMELIQV